MVFISWAIAASCLWMTSCCLSIHAYQSYYHICSCLTISTDLDELQAPVHSPPSVRASFFLYIRIFCCFSSTSRSSAVLDHISPFALCTSRRTRSMACGCWASCVSANHPRPRHRRDQNLHRSTVRGRHSHWYSASIWDFAPVGRATLRRVSTVASFRTINAARTEEFCARSHPAHVEKPRNPPENIL
jgi:hypothetical protein